MKKKEAITLLSVRKCPWDQNHLLIAVQVVLGEEIDCVRLITLNRPRQLNVISSKVVCRLLLIRLSSMLVIINNLDYLAGLLFNFI